ncbi:hypothetical protein ACFPMF_19455 [Larkinella bovis]|uniref:OmpA-like domain-containing protein n=1 Tax=Larkinella bovis TaxID=683041 RepID=A0ABW0IH88_9BACT
MKEKESEWVSIGDAMASIIAILIFFVIAVLFNSVNQRSQGQKTIDSLINKSQIMDESMMQAKLRRQETVKVLAQFYNDVTQGTMLDKAIELDTVHLLIKFKDGAFAPSSPCFNTLMQQRLKPARDYFRALLEKKLISILVIEGYTDSKPFHGERYEGCEGMKNQYYYTDNIGLSASRALEGKRTLTKDWGSDLSERVAVSGYGLTKFDHTLSEDENRRVIFKVELN